MKAREGMGFNKNTQRTGRKKDAIGGVLFYYGGGRLAGRHPIIRVYRMEVKVIGRRLVACCTCVFNPWNV